MKYKTRIFNGFFIMLLIQVSASTFAKNPTVIEVFSTQSFNKKIYIPNTEIKFFDFDKPNRVENSFPVFSNDEATARKQFDRWQNSVKGKQAEKRLKSSYIPYEKAASYGITQLPAIVFQKGRYVVYGTLNIPQAVRDFDNYQKNRRSK